MEALAGLFTEGKGQMSDLGADGRLAHPVWTIGGELVGSYEV
jgi:hypothetical protein